MVAVSSSNATWTKGRIGILSCSDYVNYWPVLLSDDGTLYRTEYASLAFPTHDMAPDTAIIPIEEWRPPVEDGVWLCCLRDDSECTSYLAVIDGRPRWRDGTVHAETEWDPIERIGDIPDGWRGDDE